MDQATKKEFDRLGMLIEKGFSALAEDLADFKLEVRGEFVSIREHLANIESDLRDIKRRLAKVEDRLENVTEYRKDIDIAFERIAAIEKHLGIKR